MEQRLLSEHQNKVVNMLVVTSSGQHFQITCRHMFLMQLQLSQETVTVFTSSWSVTSFSFQDSLVFVVVGLFNRICCYFLVKASFFFSFFFFLKENKCCYAQQIQTAVMSVPPKNNTFLLPHM